MNMKLLISLSIVWIIIMTNIVMFVVLDIYDRTLTYEEWETIHHNALEDFTRTFNYEYGVNIDTSGYEIFNRYGNVIGYVPYGECNSLDNIFDTDNQ